MARVGENRTYKTDIENYLGLDNEDFKSRMMQISVSKPSAYFALQSTFLKAILNKHVKDIYHTVYYALTAGKKVAANGRDLEDIIDPAEIRGADADTQALMMPFAPSLSEAEVDHIAKEIAKVIEKAFRDNVVERVLPKNIYNEAIGRSARKMEAGIE
jgi:hypothetical protein